MSTLPPLRVTFDDGVSLELQPRPRDMAIAERRFGFDYTEGGAFGGIYATALACLSRMNGELDRELPDTIDALMQIADVEAIEDENDPEGKDLAPAPGTG